MAYHLTREDVGTLDGGGFLPDDPLIGKAARGGAVLMHVIDLAQCADGLDRVVVISSILVDTSRGEDVDGACEDAWTADQIALGLMRELDATGLYAETETVHVNQGPNLRHVSQYVEVTTPRDGLDDHVPPGSTWTDVLTLTVAQLTDA